MELAPIQELLKRWRKLAKLLKSIPVDETWPADMEALTREMIVRDIAEIDAEIVERTGETPPTEAG